MPVRWPYWKGHPGNRDRHDRWHIRVLILNHFQSRVAHGWGGKAWKEDQEEAALSGPGKARHRATRRNQEGRKVNDSHHEGAGRGEERKEWGLSLKGVALRGLESSASYCNDCHPQAKPLHTSLGIQFFFQKLIFLSKTQLNKMFQ